MGNPLQDSVRTQPIPLADYNDVDPSSIPTDTAADVNPLQASVRTPDYDRTADILAAENANPNGRIAPITAGQALGLGRGIGGNPNTQRTYAVGEKTVHDVWGTHKVPVDADGNEVGLFSSKTPAFSKADYDASPKATREAMAEFHRDTPAEQADVAKSQQIITHPAASVQTAESAPPAQSVDPLDRMFADAMKGGGGGGVAGGKRFDPYAYRTAAYDRALADAEEVRRLRAGATRLEAGQASEEATAMDRYAKEAQARGESQAKEARGREAAYVKEAEAVAGDRFNPNHYKETRSVMQAGLDILGNIFGGIASGALGRPNENAAHLERKIAADIDAQKANHQARVEGVQAKQTAYGMMLDRFHNDQVASHMAQADELQKWRALGDARAALEKNVDAEDEWMRTRAVLDEKIAANKDQAAIAARQGGPDVLARLKKYYELKKLGADIEHTNAETGKLRSEAENPGGKGAVVNLPNGTQSQALSSEHGADYTQRTLGADKFERAVKEMQAIEAKSVGGTVISPSDRERYKGLAAEAKTAYVQMNGFKRTPNETEFHALDHIIPPEAGIASVSRGDVLDQARRLADDARRDAAHANLRDPSAANPLQDSLRTKPMPSPASLSVVPGT